MLARKKTPKPRKPTPMVFLYLIRLLIGAACSIMWGGKHILKEHFRIYYGRRGWNCQRWEEIIVLVYSVFLFRNILNACFLPSVSNVLPRIKLSLKEYWLTDLLFYSVFNESTLVCFLVGWVFSVGVQFFNKSPRRGTACSLATWFESKHVISAIYCDLPVELIT